MKLKTFNKEIINFNELGYKNAINTLHKTIEVINSYSEFTNKLDIQLTIDELKLIQSNKQEYTNKYYLKVLNEICNNFGLDFDKVKLKEYTWNNPMFATMANNKAQPVYDMANAINNVSYQCSIIFDFIEIKDNIASPKLNYEEELKEVYTDYTDNDRQNKILSITKKYKECIEEYEKLNVNRNSIYNILYCDLSINSNILKQC